MLQHSQTPIYFWEQYGPWDVDNDGDGILDSVWVDLGLPVRSRKNETLYKPLFAILCVDLDGRLNLNAHGSTAQLAAGYTQVASGPYAGGSGANSSLTLPRGQGYGPADINLGLALNINPTDVSNLLQGNATLGIRGPLR